MVHHSANGVFAIRDGKWKLVLGDGSGGRENPRGKPFGQPYQLYDMSSDIGETTDWRSSTLRLSLNGHPSLIQFASGDGVGNLACPALRLCKRDRIGRTGPPVHAVFWKKKQFSSCQAEVCFA